MNTHDELRGALHRRADGIGDEHPLSLDDVVGRARGIRRRRVAVSGLAAAAVLAVAVPLGLQAVGAPGASPAPDPANPSPSPSRTAVPSVRPVGQLLTTDRPEVAEQSLTTVTPGSIDPPAGASPVPVEMAYQSVVPLGDGWVAVHDDGGDLVVDRLDATGAVDGSYAVDEGGLTVSRDGSVVAWSDPDNRVVTMTDGAEPRELYRADGPVEVAAVAASGSCAPGTDDGCVVHVNRLDRVESFTVTSQGDVAQTPGVAWVTSVADDGRTAAMLEFDETGSCSGVLAAGSQRPQWRTCDYKDLTFSPDGRFVSGIDAQSDGAGSPSLAVLDADTGEVVTSLVNDRRTQAFVAQAEWDDAGAVVMTVAEKGGWRVMRLTPDGDFSAVRDGYFFSGDDFVSDLRLETRP